MNAVALEIEFEPAHDQAAPTLLKQQVGERLTAHRLRRAQMAGAVGARVVDSPATPQATAASSRSRQIAAAVAGRYANSPSYHAFLAAEAEEATRRAQAAADIAVRTAQAVAAAQVELMEELAALPVAATQDQSETAAEISMQHPSGAPVAQVSRAGLSVKLFADEGRFFERPPQAERVLADPHAFSFDDSEQARALDEEILFRQSPTFQLEQPSVAIPGNLLEFPRQLVAARKARPRYAEGPLTDESGHDGTQLRIFEVEPEQIAMTQPVEASAAEWSSIWLDAPAPDTRTDTRTDAREEASAEMQTAPLDPATIERRVMAAMVDGCLVLAGFVGSATTFAWRVPAMPSFGLAAAVSAVAIVGLFVIYQALFFTLSDATPGMRYARIGLCTFEDENPTRAAMRRRIFAVLLAGCPGGLGFLWALIDDHRLGWHDRISRMYQRGY